MKSLHGTLKSVCRIIGKPLVTLPKVVVRSRLLPDAYLTVLGAANGFSTGDGTFRFFGTLPVDALPAIDEWNNEEWIAEYGPAAKGLVFFAEDILGDQYGFEYDGTAREPRLIKFLCEGGAREPVNTHSMRDWLLSEVLSSTPSAFDMEFIRAALSAGLRPNLRQHLSFRLPLVVGGSYDLTNLEVADSRFHLHLLGQMVEKNRTLPDGTPIRSFHEQ